MHILDNNNFFLTIDSKIYCFAGCLNCYARDTVNSKTMHDLYQAPVEKAGYLKDQGFNVVEVLECEIKRELEQDEDMKSYFDNYELVDPLEPRAAFYGGRTNAAKLFHEYKDDEKIKYVDNTIEFCKSGCYIFLLDIWFFTSLYP